MENKVKKEGDISQFTFKEQDTIQKGIVALQKRIYKRNALRKIKELSGIDIKRQSQINILSLYNRLRLGSDLPEAIRNTINAEKKNTHNALTPEELKFYKELLLLPLTANHATHSSEAILSGNRTIYSSNQLEKRKITTQTHTSKAYGEHHFVFLSYTLGNQISTVNFLGAADIFVINLDDFAIKEPLLYAATWSSGHFYAYDTEQTAKPVHYLTKQSQTTVHTHYEVSVTPVIQFQRHIIFEQSAYKTQQTLVREQEVSLGRHIKPYHLLRLIEFIRFLDLDIRKMILKEGHNEQLISKLFNSVFTPGKAEMLTPEILPIHNGVSMFSLKRSGNIKQLTADLIRCIQQNDTNKLKKYLSTNTRLLSSYRFENDQKANLSLLNLAVLNKNQSAIRLLLKYGDDAAHQYSNQKQTLYWSYAERSSLQDAIELQDFQLIQCLFNTCKSKRYSVTTSFLPIVGSIEMFTAIADKIDIDIVNYLLKKFNQKADALAQLLVAAVFYNNLEVLELLLQLGADPNSTIEIRQDSDNGHLIPLVLKGTALTIAVEFGRLSAVTMLLDYSADVNAYIKEDSTYYKLGKGASPLIVWYQSFDQADKIPSRCFAGTGQCRYQHLLNGTKQQYYQILEILLQKNADVFYIAGNNSYFPALLRNYLDSNWDWFLEDTFKKLLDSQNDVTVSKSSDTNTEFEYEAYAVITAKDQKNGNQVLLAEQLTDHVKKNHWFVPGGAINYLTEQTLVDTIVTIASHQTGLNLSNIIPSHKECYGWPEASLNPDDLVEIHHYALPMLIEKYFLYQTTPNAHIFQRKRDHHYSHKLCKIQWADLNEINIEWISYQNVKIPLCFYKDKSLPILAGLMVTELSGQVIPNKKAVQQIATQLYYQGFERFSNAVITGNLVEVKHLVQLQLPCYHDFSNMILTGLIHYQYEMVSYLITVNLPLSVFEFVQHFNRCDLSKCCHPETTMLDIYQKYQFDIHENSYLVRYLADFAAYKNYPTLFTIIIANVGQSSDEIIEGSARKILAHFQLRSLKMIFDCIPIIKHSKLLANLIKYHIHGPQKGDNYAEAIQCIAYLLDRNTNFNYLKSNCLLSNICKFYRAIAEENADDLFLLNQCLTIIKTLIKHQCFTFRNLRIYYPYAVLSKLGENSEAIKKAADNYLATITQIPVTRLEHIVRRGSLENVVELLDKYHTDIFIRQDLIDKEHYIHVNIYANGETCFRYAVKNNFFRVVQLLLETGYNHPSFDINEADKDGKTAVQVAIALGYVKVAKLLINHGATVDLNLISPHPELTKFMERRTINEENHAFISKNKQLLVISTESPRVQDNLSKTGDVDYATCISQAMQALGLEVHYFKSNTQERIDKLLNEKIPLTFHLMLNAPYTGFAVKIPYVKQLKEKGCKIVITVIEFAKHTNIADKHSTLDYLSLANTIIFLDDHDAKAALELARIYIPQSTDIIKNSAIIAVPPTIAKEHVNPTKENSNIMCFGIIRAGKGFAHVLKLAELIKNSECESMQKKHIYIVGTVQTHKTRQNGTAYDGELYKILCNMYPARQQDFYNKSPEQLVAMQQCITEKPVLPIKLFFNVNQEQLADLFTQCEYTVYPAYRGATLRNSSISTSLAYGNIIFSHIGEITPDTLKDEGEYHEAMVLFDNSDYNSYAENIFSNILLREQSKQEYSGSYGKTALSLNDRTRQIARKLLNNELSLDKIVNKHLALYAKLVIKNQPMSIEGFNDSLANNLHNNGLFRNRPGITNGINNTKTMSPF